MNEEMLGALDALEKEKGIKKEVVIEAIQAALISAYKRNYGQAQNVDVEFDQQSGNIHVYAVKKVVDEVADDRLEISLTDALKINRAYEVGDDIKREVTPKNFGRISAQTAKQVIMQRLREAERSKIFNEYTQYEHEIIQGTVLRRDNKFIYVDLGDIEAVMSKQDQIPNEDYQVHDKIKVFVSKVENTTKGPQVFVSRTNPELVKRLFEQEIPEVYDGTVELVSIAREAGDRSKVAVRSMNPNVDPVGTCVGPKGQRVQAIVNELNGENMDIVKWEEDPSDYIANALNPAEVIAVQFDQDKRECMVIVPDYQLSLAIGKRGQNARLAAKLTGFKIDIKPESEVEFVSDDDDTANDPTDADSSDNQNDGATTTTDSEE
ncbi:transcription termination factor NusA [Lapidilactobacillus wuchangensis]|uniref:transcription termination factor NusA n=1 Tax=Lapidilactobacillus wuchangensis TaxID=2486001 RepID=UPI000F79E406|nr:transcription termination factor NusA [Lapidilactobacillus wuchangensis]